MRALAAIAVSAAAISLAHPAAAQDGADPYGACAQIEDDAARLACFDRTYSAQLIETAEREEVEEERREEVFGFRDEDAALERAQEEATLTAQVAEVLQGARRSQVLMLDNGQLWREITGSTLRNRVREGWNATVTQHWSGAYEMRFEGRSGYLRVARMR